MVCNAEAASVEAVAKEYGDEVNFVGVAWSGNADEFAEFIARHELTFPQIADEPGEVFARFEVLAQPAAVIVAADGTTETLTGRADGETIADALDAALG